MATTTEEEQRKLQEQAQEEQAQGAATRTEEAPAVKREPVTATHVEAPRTDPSQSAYAQYMANYPKYDEEEEQRKLKRARSAMLLGAISDGISAMSNLYATKRYAPSAMNAKSPTLSDRAKKIYDEVEKTRQANRKAWQQGADKAAALRQKDAQDANKTKLDIDKFNARQDQDAAKFNSGLPAKNAQDAANLKKTGAQTAHIEGATANAETLTEARVGQLNASENAQNALAGKRNAEASGGSGSGRYYGTFRDKEYATKADYETAVLLAADEYGIPITEDKDLVGDQRDIAINRLATACEEEYRKRKSQGGSTSQSDDNTEHTWDIGGSSKGDTGHTWGKKK